MPPTIRINYPVVVVLTSILFQAGLVASATGAVIPEVITDLRLRYSAAALLPFTYFIAYALISVPAGIVFERVRPKALLLAAYGLGVAGAAIFAMHPRYPHILVGLFAMGCWMAAAQVGLFPIMRIACGAENLAFFTVLTTLGYGVGSVLGPRLYSTMTRAPEWSAWFTTSPTWSSMYWIFVAIGLVTAVVLSVSRLPLTTGDRPTSIRAYASLFGHRTVLLYAAAVVCYTACEQGCANWMSEFLFTRHAVDPKTEGAAVLSWYWLMLSAGCLAGMVLVKMFDSRRILSAAACLAAVALTTAVFGSREVSLVAFPLVGLFESVLWPILVELALNSVAEHQAAVSGILMSSVAGGALGPYLVGSLGEVSGLQGAFAVLYAPLAFIAYVGLRARPLVRNATLLDAERPTSIWQ